MKKTKESYVPPLNPLLRFLLSRYKERILQLPFTDERSDIVEFIDCTFEVAKGEVNYVR